MHPVLFEIFGFEIAPYGVLLAVGILLAVAVAVWRARRAGVSDEAVLDVAFFGTIGGFVGGRVVYILTHLAEFRETPWDLIFSRSGFTFLGGLALGVVVVIVVIRRRGERMFNVADVGAPSLALAHGFGRLGCFTAGCCYGSVCPPAYEGWGVRFPRESLPYWDHFADLIKQYQDGVAVTLPDQSLPVWPTQLYEAGGNFLIFALLFFVLWRRRRFEGQIFSAYLLLYGALRFGVEFLRGDADRGIWRGLSTSQWLSALCVVAAVGLWLFLRRRALPASAEAAPSESPPGQTSEEPPPPKRKRHKSHKR